MAVKKVLVNRNIPHDRQDLCEKMRELGRLERIRESITIEMNEKISNLKTRYSEECKEYDNKISSLQEGIASYCEVHRDELTDNGKTKTVKLPTGTLSWRFCPPSCRISKPEVVLETLKAKKLARFIRIKEEISKDLILSDIDAVAGIKGITIVQGKEELTIEPDKEDLGRTA